MGMLGVACLVTPVAADDLTDARELYCKKTAQCSLEERPNYQSLSSDQQGLLYDTVFDLCEAHSAEFEKVLVPLDLTADMITCLNEVASKSCSDIKEERRANTMSAECKAMRDAWNENKKPAS
ncbi:hypothetical protein GCM10007924_01020 [Sneathiella chinensis]|uniref:Secreted protein n=2 Tax=Sneathiella chinensis TaxID=349750 RepID=A0ABQ5U0D8_9PROT|nr:hypothetical protein GCM10007924_01020 [Sneathiella chinensis]